MLFELSLVVRVPTGTVHEIEVMRNLNKPHSGLHEPPVTFTLKLTG